MLEDALQLAERGSSRLTRARVNRSMDLCSAASESEESAAWRSCAKSLAEMEQLSAKDELFAATAFLADSLGVATAGRMRFRTTTQALEAVQEHSRLSNRGAQRRIGTGPVELGEIDEAARIAEEAVATTAKDDLATVASTLMVRGRVREAQGRTEEAEADLREAVAVISKTDYNAWEEHLALAEFLFRQGRTEDATAPEAAAFAAWRIRFWARFAAPALYPERRSCRRGAIAEARNRRRVSSGRPPAPARGPRPHRSSSGLPWPT